MSDLVADGQTRRLFVANAWNGGVLIVDSTTNGIVTQVKVPQVWALDLRNGKPFAVNHHQRQLFVLDAAMLKPIQTITLLAPPINVAATMSKVVVRFRPIVLGLPDFSPLTSDRLDYDFGPRSTAEFGPRSQSGRKRFAITTKGLQLTVRTEKGDESRILPLPQNTMPVALTTLSNRLFIATDKGVLAIWDMEADTPIATLQITNPLLMSQQ